MKTVIEKAYAKINLGLDVIRKREDGYHELRMIMQTVDLYDILVFQKKEKGITVITDKPELPGDENNLIYKAVKLLVDTCRIKEGVSVELKKNIPMEAGLAGGSSDAAAVFRGMNELFSLGLTRKRMCELGVKLGADIPYCIMGGTVLAEGIGEILTELPDMPDCFLLLDKPKEGMSSGYVYRNLHAGHLTFHPDIDGMMEAIRKEQLTGITDRLGNVLETVTVRECPVIDKIKQCMVEQGALGSLMSGSGSTVFGVFESAEKAEKACQVLKKEIPGQQIFITRPVSAAMVKERNETVYE